MWSLYDDYKNVFELQAMLREISKSHTGIRLLNPDGMFLSETAAAVRDFQNMFGLTPSGEVDNLTWNTIYEKYLNNLMI